MHFHQVCDEEIEDDFAIEDQGPKWFAGPWTGCRLGEITKIKQFTFYTMCSKICGDGIKTRELTCYKKIDEGTIEVLEEGECPSGKPAMEEPCSNDTPCEAADWIVSGEHRR